MIKIQLATGLAMGLILASGLVRAEETVPAQQSYKLKQVVMMSRHNLRAPLSTTGSVLEQSSSRSWPRWDVSGGELTTKGGILEVYMGHYIREWLSREGLVKSSNCPVPDSVYIYANSLQRTVATAQFFTTGAFPGCDVPVHHQPKMGTMDPTFNPVITDRSVAFRQQAVAAMEKQRSGYRLDESYKLLEQIAGYATSPGCQAKSECSLTQPKDRFSAELNQEPSVKGPLKVGNALVDAFTLQYYEGFAEKDVAWGKIESEQQWRLLSALKNSYQDSLFSSETVARHVAAPLITYLHKALNSQGKNKPSLTLLVGHDSNIASLLSALSFNDYQLPGQYERTPIGGKIVFERWYDQENNRDLMKIEYLYQTAEQLRKGEPLSLESPPQRVTLSLKGCPVDSEGYCPVETFSKVLEEKLRK